MPVAILNNGTFNTTAVSPWPDATNTGYRNAPGYPGSLANGSALTIASNTTYSFYDFPGGAAVGSSGSQVSNVTFSGCRFTGTGAQNALATLFGDNITFSYCSFEPASLSAPPVDYANSYQFGIEGAGGANTTIGQLLVQYCDFWGWGNAIDCQGSTQAKPQVFQYNWIHDSSVTGTGNNYHNDGIGSESAGASTAVASYVVIRGNTINSLGNTQAIAFQQNGNYDHFLITGNLLGGFGYTVAVIAGTGSVSNIGFSGNTFTTQFVTGQGPLYTDSGFTGYPDPYWWRNNKWHVPAGAAWGNPAHDGWYWMPVTGGTGGTQDDTPFVSLTDYTG